MKSYSRMPMGLFPFLAWVLLGSLVMLAITLFFKWHAIEKDVAENSRQSLAAADIEWATLETFNNGREVTITGTPPSKDEATLALNIVRQSKGVDEASFEYNEIVIEPKSPAYLNAIVTRNSMVLRGTLENQNAIDQLLSQAKAVFGNDNVVNKMSIGKNVAPLAKQNGLFDAMKDKGNSAPFSASFLNDELTINGQVINSKQKIRVEEQIAVTVESDIVNNLTVVIPQIKQDVCLELVNDLLSNSKINFETGKANISQSSHDLLINIANIAKRCKKSKFEIAGHTDSTGNLESNMALSQQRSQAVVNHLVGLGLTEERFTPVGYGPNKPIGDNSSPEGREQNRRIEFLLKDAPNEQNSTN